MHCRMLSVTPMLCYTQEAHHEVTTPIVKFRRCLLQEGGGGRGKIQPGLQPKWVFALQASAEEVVVKALKYRACVDVIDSDHKPVWALLALDVPVTNQEKKRRMCSHILKQTAAQGQAPDRPALQASCDSVQLNQVQLRRWSARPTIPFSFEKHHTDSTPAMHRSQSQHTLMWCCHLTGTPEP